MKTILLTIGFFTGQWMLDIGHVVYFIRGETGALTNGFWSFSALQTYHFGWYLSIICFVLLVWEFKKLETKYLSERRNAQ